MEASVGMKFADTSRLLAAAALAAGLALGYAALRGGAPDPAGTFEKLRIALPPVPHAALLHISEAKGYFADEGLEIATVPAIHGKTALDLVLQGKADLGTASEVAFVLSAIKSEPLGIAANMFSSSNDLAVVARRDRGISAPRDIAGKRVGVTLGTASEFFLWAFLIRHKLPPDSVTLVELPPGRIAQAIAAGTVDAISTWEPNALNARLALGDGAMTFHEPLAYTETFNLIGRRDFLTNRFGAIERLLRALLRAEQFVRTHPDEALGIVAGRLGIDANAMRPAWGNFSFRVELLQSQLNTMEDEARWALARGYVEKGPIPNFLPNLYLEALLAVQPQRVTVMR